MAIRSPFTGLRAFSRLWMGLYVASRGLEFSLALSGFNNNNELPPASLPSSSDAMVRQAARAISSALLNDRIHLQTIRLPLSETMYSDSEEGFVADRAIGWQGGPQETCRYLLPLVKQLLQITETVSTEGSTNNPNPSSGLVARVREQILLDFDGSALLTSECPLDLGETPKLSFSPTQTITTPNL